MTPGEGVQAEPREQWEGGETMMQTRPTVKRQRHNANQVVVAIARARRACMWAMAQEVPLTA
jgi:hypothetical protein